MAATLNGIPFHVNPSSVAWQYNVRLASHKTIGGKVIQIYGFNMDDLTVSGHFGRGAIERQREFFDRVKAIADDQVPPYSGEAVRPVRFLWPEQRWDFWVFIKALTQGGAGVSIETAMNISNPSYTLTLHVAEDNGEIVKVAASSAQAAYLKRLTAGLGWRQSEWNGPETLEDLHAVLQGRTFLDYAFTQYGLTPDGTGLAPTVPGTDYPGSLGGFGETP